MFVLPGNAVFHSFGGDLNVVSTVLVVIWCVFQSDSPTLRLRDEDLCRVILYFGLLARGILSGFG